MCVVMGVLQHLICFGVAGISRLRKHPGYDLNDPWLVVGELDDVEAVGSGGQKRRAPQPLVAGAPCRHVGTDDVVAYLCLGPSEGECHVRSPSGGTDVRLRRNLLPLPTRQAGQGDWAMPVALEGKAPALR